MLFVAQEHTKIALLLPFTFLLNVKILRMFLYVQASSIPRI
jgi:hypothetical protein